MPLEGYSKPLALIVDRDDDSRELYATVLELNHWRVIAAGAGPEALARAIADRPDVVVSETFLPGFDGLTLSALLAEDWGTAHIPVVFVTSDATPANLAKATATGAAAVLTKPCPPDALLSAVEAARQQARQLRRRAAAAKAEARMLVADANETVERIAQQQRIVRSLKSSHQRGDTIAPPIAPPSVTCPRCNERLLYLRSYVGGVSLKHREQWDYFECPRRCGTFEYRARTRKLRRVPPPLNLPSGPVTEG